jgi:methylphosphotriester-DNA--protein-cysteine methyltransferase
MVDKTDSPLKDHPDEVLVKVDQYFMELFTEYIKERRMKSFEELLNEKSKIVTEVNLTSAFIHINKGYTKFQEDWAKTTENCKDEKSTINQIVVMWTRR